MTVSFRDQIAEKSTSVEILSTMGIVEKLRQIKDAEEIAEIRQAVYFAEKAFGVVRAAISPEQTEKQLADLLEHQMRLFGARGPAFDSIVAAGPRAALPHAHPTQRPIGDAASVLIDWGRGRPALSKRLDAGAPDR